MQDNLGLKGRLRIEHIHLGETEVLDVNNTVVTLGKAQASHRLVSGAYAQPDPYRYMAIGIGSDTIAAADTTLGSEYLRYTTTGSTTTTTTTNDTARWIGSFGIDATKTVNEAGLFNKSGLDLGSILSRTCFAGLSAVSGDQINITWDVALS